MVTVLKTVVGRPTASSNLALSARITKCYTRNHATLYQKLSPGYHRCLRTFCRNCRHLVRHEQYHAGSRNRLVSQRLVCRPDLHGVHCHHRVYHPAREISLQTTCTICYNTYVGVAITPRACTPMTIVTLVAIARYGGVPKWLKGRLC